MADPFQRRLLPEARAKGEVDLGRIVEHGFLQFGNPLETPDQRLRVEPGMQLQRAFPRPDIVAATCADRAACVAPRELAQPHDAVAKSASKAPRESRTGPIRSLLITPPVKGKGTGLIQIGRFAAEYQLTEKEKNK